MKLTSMKRTKKERTADEATVAPVAYEEDDYPYGLEIRLEKAELTKLGIDIDSLSIGGTVDMECAAETTQLRETANRNNEQASASFQITDMAITARPRAEKLRDILKLVSNKLGAGAGA